MEGSISIPATAIWTALGALVPMLISASVFVSKKLEAKDAMIAELQNEIKQKLKDDIEYLRRIEMERSNV